MGVKILGIAASLRNARRSLGKFDLVDQIHNLESKESLKDFLNQEALQHLSNFKEAGRSSAVPFDDLYKNLKKQKGDRGLSNSELFLTSALWSANQLGSEIDFLSLSEHFDENNEVKNLEVLKQKIMDADALLVSGPVYFGDRGSLTQAFINFLRDDDEIRKTLKNKVYAGCSVGAKRNGGQETLLIYQLWDMVQLGCYGVGNDSETTSQYGGTGHAGDIGTGAKDDYGHWSARGTGRRIARVAEMIKKGLDSSAKISRLKVGFFILQDRKNIAQEAVMELIKGNDEEHEFTILDIHNNFVKRCLACDICPTHIDVDSEYRCIIKAKNDDMSNLHENFMNYDVVIPVTYSSVDRKGLKSNYQKFIERTRYIRRGDYVMSDIISSPLVIEDLDSNENMALRSLTSTLRHHTIVRKPLILKRHGEKLLNLDKIKDDFSNLMRQAIITTTGKLEFYSNKVDHLGYNPVGYVLAPVKDAEDKKIGTRLKMLDDRLARYQKEKEERINT